MFSVSHFTDLTKTNCKRQRVQYVGFQWTKRMLHNMVMKTGCISSSHTQTNHTTHAGKQAPQPPTHPLSLVLGVEHSEASAAGKPKLDALKAHLRWVCEVGQPQNRHFLCCCCCLCCSSPLPLLLSRADLKNTQMLCYEQQHNSTTCYNASWFRLSQCLLNLHARSHCCVPPNKPHRYNTLSHTHISSSWILRLLWFLHILYNVPSSFPGLPLGMTSASDPSTIFSQSLHLCSVSTFLENFYTTCWQYINGLSAHTKKFSHSCIHTIHFWTQVYVEGDSKKALITPPKPVFFF